MVTISKPATIEKGFGPPILSSEVKNHNDDAVVIKKVKKAKETLEKVGLPDFKK